VSGPEPVSKLIPPVVEMVYVRKIVRDVLIAYTDWIEDGGFVTFELPEIVDEFIESDEYQRVVP
jgi:hypothetical protein